MGSAVQTAAARGAAGPGGGCVRASGSARARGARRRRAGRTAAPGSFKTSAPAARPKKVAYVARHRDVWRHHVGTHRSRFEGPRAAGTLLGGRGAFRSPGEGGDGGWQQPHARSFCF